MFDKDQAFVDRIGSDVAFVVTKPFKVSQSGQTYDLNRGDWFPRSLATNRLLRQLFEQRKIAIDPARGGGSFRDDQVQGAVAPSGSFTAEFPVANPQAGTGQGAGNTNSESSTADGRSERPRRRN